MSDDVRINGNQVSWGSIILKIKEERFTGFTSISYGDSRERVKAYGMGRSHAPRGRSKGKYSTDPVVLTGWKGSGEELRRMLAEAGGGSSFGDVQFQIVVQYIETGDTPITDVIEECVYIKTSSSNEEGPDPLSEDIELDCMRIRWNTKTLFDDSDIS